MKKTGSKKSRDTVPLIADPEPALDHSYFIKDITKYFIEKKSWLLKSAKTDNSFNFHFYTFY
jgi:hypothetical protein